MQKQITRNIIVKSSPEEAFQIWSDFQNFPHFMKYIKTVTKTGLKTSHWEVEGPVGSSIEWDAEITRFEENKRIGWSTKDRQGDIKTSGQVSFNPLPNGETEITVMFQYVPPAGATGDTFARIFANPEQRLAEDLQNFKEYVERMHERTAT
jgi:uncharacterized membrane protein